MYRALNRVMFFCGSASEGPSDEIPQITRPTFSCSTPTFIFGASGPAQKAVLVPFFWGWFL
jgi:hypothetical protein